MLVRFSILLARRGSDVLRREVIEYYAADLKSADAAIREDFPNFHLEFVEVIDRLPGERR